MAGNGPLPKGERQRERDTRRRDKDVAVVTPDGVVRGPELPAGHTFSPDTVEWYQTWRRSPQAQLFEETDWLALRLLLPLVESHSRRPSAAALSEIRLTTAALGGTYADRLRVAKIRVDHSAEDGPDAVVTPLHAVSKADVTARLRGDKQPTRPEEAPEDEPGF